MECPACGKTLKEVTAKDIKVDVCDGGCGGIWFDQFELQKVDEPHESAGESLLNIEREKNINIEVIDLRSLIPLDKETIINSVKKTNKVLIVHEDKVFGGFGGELTAIITEEAFEYLDAPIKRIGSTFTPVGFNKILEQAILPNTQKIYNAALELIDY